MALSLVDEKGAPIDGFLRLQDIFNLNLPAELVVLSACQKRVVVSLWSVSDLSTSELMQKFYTNMLKGGLKPAEAMRAAQLDMWKDKRSPYEWAAFVTQGEWR